MHTLIAQVTRHRVLAVIAFLLVFPWIMPYSALAVNVLIFGLFHGFGLATKLQDFSLSKDGLVPNILAFNVGVEIGQLLALAAILIAMGFWRRTLAFTRHAFAANALLMTAGFVLTGYQLAGYFLTTSN